MTEALRVAPGHRVLEIGTGSGYQAAILGELAREVYTIEIVPTLARRAREVMQSLGYSRVQVREGRWLRRLAGICAFRSDSGDRRGGRNPALAGLSPAIFQGVRNRTSPPVAAPAARCSCR
jgi:hypothetical protein